MVLSLVILIYILIIFLIFNVTKFSTHLSDLLLSDSVLVPTHMCGHTMD